MATTQNTLIGRSSGSVGDVVFSSWKGVNVIKSSAVKKQKPPTLKQLTRQNKYGYAVNLYNQLPEIINIGLKNYAKGMSQQNLFLKYNIDNSIISNSPPMIEMIPTKMVFSKGIIQPRRITNVGRSPDSTTLRLTFFSSVIPFNGSITDVPYFIAFRRRDQLVATAIGAASPSTTNTLSFSSNTQNNDIIDIWLFFVSQDGKKVSDTAYREHIASF